MKAGEDNGPYILLAVLVVIGLIGGLLFFADKTDTTRQQDRHGTSLAAA